MTEIKVKLTFQEPLLGFPVIIIGNRVKIPRVGFIRYMEGMTSETA